MDRIKIVLPTEEFKQQILDYKKEFLDNGDRMDGTAGLKNAETFEEWYSAVLDNSAEDTVRAGLVPATTYLAVRMDDSKIVGMIDIRHRLNEHLFQFGGNIGYSIRKSERKKGYATEMLRLALIECRAMGMKKILITCDSNNIASAKTIINNSGILENEVLEDDGITQRYWITLQPE